MRHISPRSFTYLSEDSDNFDICFGCDIDCGQNTLFTNPDLRCSLDNQI
ncbi:unnamed protein product [Arabidopsis arenosa]|uniref:Uncharacterized protein n=1 Tax=Arabidopsis arenosa TaxID=38785 RepID=A0A8S1ZMK8_ARAAE|nr:unnamed protein product [Arabidopsis arenosa]